MEARITLERLDFVPHKFNNIDWKPNHPRIFHESNVSRAENIALDKEAIAMLEAGRHDQVLEAAELVRIAFDTLGLRSFVKTTGGKVGSACTSRAKCA